MKEEVLLISIAYRRGIRGLLTMNAQLDLEQSERVGRARVMVRGWQKRCRGAASRKSSVNALFRRGGFTVGIVYA